MKKILSIAVFLLFITTAAFAAGSSAGSSCKTNYPIILAHGMGATDDLLGFVDYWWGIVDAIEDEGGEVYVTKVNCIGTTLQKALQFRSQFLTIMATTGKAKANIIGHSHGTNYSRLAISNLGLAPKVASWTNINGPQRGMVAIDVMLKILPDPIRALAAGVSDFVYALLGDDNPDFAGNLAEATTAYMTNVLNPNTPNIAGIYYQTWTSKLRYISTEATSIYLGATWLITKYYDGDNDGLVSVRSAKWGNFRGVVAGAWWCGGVSHLNVVGQLFGITPGFSAPDFFVTVVSDLKNRGF